jgi:hypothetical protein
MEFTPVELKVANAGKGLIDWHFVDANGNAVVIHISRTWAPELCRAVADMPDYAD